MMYAECMSLVHDTYSASAFSTGFLGGRAARALR